MGLVFARFRKGANKSRSDDRSHKIIWLSLITTR
jgi:hypothetical protein